MYEKLKALAAYYQKHDDEIRAVFSGSGQSDMAQFFTDSLSALAAVAKIHRPNLNKTGFVDDTVALVKTLLGTV